MAKLTLVLASFGVIGLCAWGLLASGPLSEARPTLGERFSAGTDSPHSLGFALKTMVGAKPKEPMRGGANLDEAKSRLDAAELSGAQRSVAAAFGSDSHGVALRRAALAGMLGWAEESELVAEAMAALQDDPRSGYRAIASALERLPRGEEPVLRAALWATARELPGNEEDLERAALAELKGFPAPARPSARAARDDAELSAALSSSPDDFVPIAAHAAYLDATGAKPEAAFSGTVDAAVAQPNEAVRNAIAAQFAQRYPGRVRDLVDALAARGVGVLPPEAYGGASAD